MKIRQGYNFTFDDVLLVPKYGIVDSRSEVDLSTQLTKNVALDIPIISAPMSSVTEWELGRCMSLLGGFGFIHRFMSIEENVRQYLVATKQENGQKPIQVGCTLGVNEGYKRLERVYDAGCRIFVVDIAHGHCKKMKDFVLGID